MCLDVGKYRRIFCPRDPFELLPRKIIEQMIRGFFYRIRKGVTLLWSEYDAGTGEYSVKDDRIDPFDYTKKEDRQFFNHVCWEYRAKCGAEKCRNEDICITGAYLNGEMDGFRRYPCWLGMEDQAYGLKIGAHVRAVVFAGQIVPVEKERYREVQKRIHKYAPSHLVPSLIKLLCNERKRQQQRAGDYAESLRERLCEFAGMLQEILTRLYEARREAATRELLQASEEYLASAGFDDYDAWWDKCARLTQSFSELVGLIRIGILTRAGGYYRTRVPQGVVDPHIAVRDVLSMTAGQLMAATFDDSTARLAEKLALQPDNAAFFVSHAHTGVVPLSTLLFLEGGPSLEFKELTTEFCRIVAQHVDFFSLVAWQRQSQETYRVTVAQVAHDFRTPLQLVVCDLEDVAKLEQVRRNATRRTNVERSIQRALAAEEHVRRLIGTATCRLERLHLPGLVLRVMDELHAMAYPCMLRKVRVWPETVWVRGDSHQLTRALTNLMENAIKYSYGGRIVAGVFKPYTVDVSLDSGPNHMARVVISNYGIGIPPEMIEKIRSPGGRALVPDDRRERPGSGLGLPSAISILEEHGGWLDIHSDPADDGPRSLDEKYHRFVTRVDAYLPIAK